MNAVDEVCSTRSVLRNEFDRLSSDLAKVYQGESAAVTEEELSEAIVAARKR